MILENQIFNNLLPFLDNWGYFILFFSSLLEALPAIGSIFPGHSMVIASGFFIQLGVFKTTYIILLATIGAMIGDFIGYFLGRKYGISFILKHRKGLFLKTKHLDKAYSLFNSNSGKAIILGRLNPFTRAFIPFIAGISKIGYIRFLILNCLAALLWSITAVFIGYFFGSSYKIISTHIGKYFFFATLISLIIAATYYYLNKIKHAFLTKHFRYLLLNIFSLYIFSKTLEDVLIKKSVLSIDLWINEKIVLLWQPWLSKIMILLTNIFEPINFLVLSLIILSLFIYQKKWYFFSLYLTGLGGGIMFSYILKIFIQRDRPIEGLISETNFSFPSSHAIIAAIFFPLLYYFFKNN
ncbi:VTT domain-containing protein, partial [Patescibacteria group bacterium]|nr:VTT domain-containing protein [Patescibacteria group bacterium]MBU1870556.1 VTT domain-containing protein [Patescibacteria group bacterium]